MEKGNFKDRFKNFITGKSDHSKQLRILTLALCVAVIFSIPVLAKAFSDDSWLSELKDNLTSQKKQHAQQEGLESAGSEASDTEDSSGKSDDVSSPENNQNDNAQSSAPGASGENSSGNVSADRPSKVTSGSPSKGDSSGSPGSSGSSSSSNNSSSSGGNSSGSSSSESGSDSGKVWVPPVYKTVHHEAVYETRKVWICNYCKEEFSSLDGFQVHKEANGG